MRRMGELEGIGKVGGFRGRRENLGLGDMRELGELERLEAQIELEALRDLKRVEVGELAGLGMLGGL